MCVCIWRFCGFKVFGQKDIKLFDADASAYASKLVVAPYSGIEQRSR